MSMVIPNGDKCFEPGLLDSAGLFLHSIPFQPSSLKEDCGGRGEEGVIMFSDSLMDRERDRSPPRT